MKISKQNKMKQKSHTQNDMEFILCCLITLDHGASPEVLFIYPVTYHYRKLIFLCKGLSVANSFLFRDEIWSPFSFQCWDPVCAGLCVLPWCLWIHLCTSPVMSDGTVIFYSQPLVLIISYSTNQMKTAIRLALSSLPHSINQWQS